MPRPRLTCAVLPGLFLILSACDETTVSASSETRIDARGVSSCERAVRNHTENAAAQHNPGIPVVEVNQYVIDEPGATRWLCYTDDTGRAKALVRLGQTL